jgi:hypothetical protein
MWRLSLLVFLISHICGAAIELPKGLNQENREKTLKLIGMGTSSKILTDPYPLGGFPGLEISASVEVLDLSDLKNLGTTTLSTQDSVAYPRITIGKGTFANTDIFVHFTPFDKGLGISEFGGLIRMGVYQATYLPSSLSILVHTNRSTINNTLETSTYGADLIAGFSLEKMSLYFGGGMISSKGRFLVGTHALAQANSITDTNESTQESVSSLHSVMGATLRFGKFFVAAEIDRYADTTISAKLGYRN